jgi:hypothetical protein
MSAHVNDQLSAFLDRELGAGAHAAVEAHLRACEACREQLARIAAVDAAVRELPAEPPAGYFEALPGRVRQKLEAEGGARPTRAAPRSLVPVWAWAAAAALLVVVVTPRLRTPGPPSPEPPPPSPIGAAPTGRAVDGPTAGGGSGAAEPQGVPGTRSAEKEARLVPAPAAEGATQGRRTDDAGTPAEKRRAEAAPEGSARAPGRRSVGPTEPTSGEALGEAQYALKDKGRERPRKTRESEEAAAGFVAPPALPTAVAPAFVPAPGPGGAPAAAPRGEAAERPRQAPRDELARVQAEAGAGEPDAARPRAATESRAGTMNADGGRADGGMRSRPDSVARKAQTQPAAKAAGSEAADEMAYRTLLAPTSNTLEALRERREAWRAFVARFPESPHADEARVRIVETGVTAWEAGTEPGDRDRARRDAAAYLQRKDAGQAGRVRGLLTRLATSRP